MPRRYSNCEVKAHTVKALLISIEGGELEVWVPRSVVHSDSEVYDEDEHSEGDLVLPDWWADKNPALN